MGRTIESRAPRLDDAPYTSAGAASGASPTGAPLGVVDAEALGGSDSDASSVDSYASSEGSGGTQRAAGPDCSPAGCRRGWARAYRAALRVFVVLYRLVVSFLFYHSGKLTLLAAFAAACLQPNAWGLVVILSRWVTQPSWCTVRMNLC